MYLPPLSSVITVEPISVDPMSMVYESHPPSLSLDISVIQKLTQDALLTSRLTVRDMKQVPNHLHRISEIQLSNNAKIILKASPSTTAHVLRHEADCLQSEAAVFGFLAKTNLPIPRILKYERRNLHLGSPFLLTTHLPGTRYSDVLPYLSLSERQDVELQLRSMTAYISTYTAPTFGPVAKLATGTGFPSWREAFYLMMKTVLMDGEDKGVNLPYIEIREALIAHARSLDTVREARLVILGLGRPANMLIDRRTNDVTGLLDFGRAIWGDIGLGEPESCPGVRGLL